MEGNDHGKGRSRIVMLERKVQTIKKGNPLILVQYIHAVILKRHAISLRLSLARCQITPTN